MEKKKSIIVIALISLLSVLLAVFSVVSFRPSNAITGFAGFAGAIEKGTDFEGGLAATYTPVREEGVTDEEFNASLNKTYEKIQSLLEQKGFDGTNMFLTTSNQIRVETRNADDAKAMLNEFGAGELKIRTSSDSTAEVKISGKNITSSFATQSSSTYYWGTYIGLDEEGTQILEDITEKATSSSSVYLYFYRGDSTDYFYRVPASSQIDSLFISSSNGSMTQEDAINFAIQILAGSFDVTLELDGEVEKISSSTGNQSTLGLIIAAGVAVVVILIIFGVVYRELGLMAIVSILLYISLSLFFMQAIPAITLSVPTLGAMLLGLILIAACHFILLEKIRNEFKTGKKLSTCAKTGHKKSIALILEICGSLAILSTIAYFILTDIMKSFALVTIVCSVLAAVVTICVTYVLNKCYCVLNPANGKRVNFSREENIDENE